MPVPETLIPSHFELQSPLVPAVAPLGGCCGTCRFAQVGSLFLVCQDIAELIAHFQGLARAASLPRFRPCCRKGAFRFVGHRLPVDQFRARRWPIGIPLVSLVNRQMGL